MAKLPRMSDSQKLGKQGENFVERVFTDAGWNTIIILGGSDFHSDFSVEIFSNGALTGCRFGVQVKAHRSIKILKDGSIRQSMKTSTLNAFLEQGDLVILVCYDVSKKVGYWCWIQDYIRQKLPRGWQEKHKPTIKIPSSQILDDSAIEEIRKRVMTHGTKLKFTQLAETTNDPYYNIFPKINNEGTHLVFSEKFPGASEIDPISFDFSVDFDDTPEGLAVRGAMEKHFKTGSTVAIPGQFITDFKGADVFRRIFGDDTHNKPSLLVVKPNESQQPEPVSFELLDGEGKQLFCFKYLELKVVQRGSEEATYRLRDRAETFEVVMIMNTVKEKCIFDYRLLRGLNVVDNLIKLYKFKSAFQHCKQVRIANLSTEIETNIPIEIELIDPEIDQLLRFLTVLKEFETVFGVTFDIPTVIKRDDVKLANDLMGAYRVGWINWDVEPFTLRLPAGYARTVIENYRKDATRIPVFFGSEYPFELFGATIDLGEKALAVVDHEIVEVSANPDEEKQGNKEYLDVAFRPISDKSRAIVFLKQWYNGDAKVFEINRTRMN